MSTATKKKIKHSMPVAFSNVSIGDETARIGVKIDRANLSIESADEILCGKRCEVKIELGTQDDASGQQYIEGTVEAIEATVDIKRYSVSPKAISAGLTFALSEVEPRALAPYAKGKGRLLVTKIEDIPEDDEESEGDEERHKPGQRYFRLPKPLKEKSPAAE